MADITGREVDCSRALEPLAGQYMLIIDDMLGRASIRRGARPHVRPMNGVAPFAFRGGWIMGATR